MFLQVLQVTLAGLYGLVALSAAAGWLPSACFGALCLASPVVGVCCAHCAGMLFCQHLSVGIDVS